MKKLNFTLILTFLTTFISVGQENIDNSGNLCNNTNLIELKNSLLNKKSGSNTAIIVNVIPSPNQSTSINDIAFDGQFLWVEGNNEFLLHQISPIDGSIIKSIPTNVQAPYGLTFDGTYLWLSDNNNRIIQKIDTLDGTVLQTFPTPSTSSSSSPGGLAWDGQNLWHNDMMGTNANPYDSTYNITTSGQTIQSFHSNGTYTHGLTWDGQYLWSSDNISGEIYKIDVASFTVIDTIDAPGGSFPNGLTFDGQYLWVANNDADSIYQVDIGYNPTGVYNLPQTLNNLTIHPNPTSNLLFVSGQEVINRIEIISLSGETIMSSRQNMNTINVKNLPKGIYSIILVTDDGRISKKFIKQ